MTCGSEVLSVVVLVVEVDVVVVVVVIVYNIEPITAVTKHAELPNPVL